jgi:hypothetical protein
VPSYTAGTYHVCLRSQLGQECKGYGLLDVAPRSSADRYMKLIRNVGTCIISLIWVAEGYGVSTLTVSDFDPLGVYLRRIFIRCKNPRGETS